MQRPSPSTLTIWLPLAAILLAPPTQAQTGHPVQSPTAAAIDRALATISEADFRGKLAALAHDSTQGRETPSPGLEAATDWVALQFARAGLVPGGDADGFLQRFPLRNTRLDSLTTVTVSGLDCDASWRLGREIVYAVAADPIDLADVPVILLVGIPEDSANPFGDVSVEGAALLHLIAPDQLSGRILNPIHLRANRDGAVAHIVAAELPSAQWDRFVQGSFPDRWEVPGLELPGDDVVLTVYGLRMQAAMDLLLEAGEDPAVLAPDTPGAARPLPGVTLSVHTHHTAGQEATVANVVGVLEGSHAELRHEAVVFTSHMDHVGVIGGRCRPSEALPADSICNGADDNASGTVGLIELAEAFATLEPRPARTLVFVAATAEERGLLGSFYYASHPVIPIERTVADLNLDMIARNPRDTVGMVGKDFTSLGAVVDRIVRERPELRLTPVDRPIPYRTSDHYPFAVRGVPAAFFFSGMHPDLHTAADNPERADAEQAARITQLAFLTALAVANDPRAPVWEPDAREAVVR